MKAYRIPAVLLTLVVAATFANAAELKEPLDRRAIVERHVITTNDLNQLLPVGNGNFCFNVDGTGLQTFSGDVLSHWGWYADPLPSNRTWQDVSPTGTYSKGRLVGGDPFPSDKSDLYSWIRNNPRQMNLARVRFLRANGDALKPEEIGSLERTLDPWTGVHRASFQLDGERVQVATCVSDDVELDSTVAIKIDSKLVASGALAVEITIPNPSLTRNPWTGDFGPFEPIKTPDKAAPQKYNIFSFKNANGEQFALVERKLVTEYAENVVGNFSYNIRVDLFKTGECSFHDEASQKLIVKPTGDSGTLEIALTFDGGDYQGDLPNDARNVNSVADVSQARLESFHFEAVERESQNRWKNFWLSGGAVDLSGSRDPRWFELERRIVLSQFILRTCAGDWPCSESGLLAICPWSGRFHLEMIWQHLIHWWAWNRAELAEKPISVYWNVLPSAQALAKQLDYKGAKWQKEIAPDGRTAPWVGNLALLWKQPHPIHFAETDYRLNPTRETLEKWERIVELTAAHMADYPTKDENGVYHLDPVMPPDEQGFTKDDLFDLAYWRWALDAANTWRERLGKERRADWDDVRRNLAPLPQKDGVYVHSAEWLDTFEKRNWEHPDLIGIWGMVPPTDAVDKETAIRTLERVEKEWTWSRCWGWDFPWLAIAGARLERPDLAIEGALMDEVCNVYDVSGVNLGGPSARGGKGPYLPGNAGLLYAIAGMCVGFDETSEGEEASSGDTAPGFPEGWNVKWEGLRRPL